MSVAAFVATRGYSNERWDLDLKVRIAMDIDCLLRRREASLQSRDIFDRFPSTSGGNRQLCALQDQASEDGAFLMAYSYSIVVS